MTVWYATGSTDGEKFACGVAADGKREAAEYVTERLVSDGYSDVSIDAVKIATTARNGYTYGAVLRYF